MTYDRRVADNGAVTASVMRVSVALTDMTYRVVRVTTTTEPLAGPFKTRRQAQKWIASGAQPLAARDPEGSLGGETSSGVNGPTGGRAGHAQVVGTRGRPRGTTSASAAKGGSDG